MTVAEMAALLAAVAFIVLVALAARPLIKLNKTIDATTETVLELRERGIPLLERMDKTVDRANAELDRLHAVTDDASRVAANAADVSDDAAQFSSLMSNAFGKPIVKTAAFSYGLRKALEAKK